MYICRDQPWFFMYLYSCKIYSLYIYITQWIANYKRWTQTYMYLHQAAKEKEKGKEKTDTYKYIYIHTYIHVGPSHHTTK